MIAIENNRALGAEWRPSPNIGGRMEPQLIVLHETAGRLAHGNSADWLCNPRAKVSAHFTVERDGSIIQLVDCDRVAWHAGASEYQGRANCNGYAIGIEIVGPGALRRAGDVCIAAGFNQSWPIDECVERDSAAHGGKRWWLPFTQEQIAATEALVAALLAAYPRIADVVGHYEISPGRKVDPSPLYPIDACRMLCLGREPPPDDKIVRAAQSRLLELGYDVGAVDGLAGPKLRGRIRDFQDQNGLAITGELDDATVDRLSREDAVEMTTGTRAAATKADVATPATKAGKRAAEATGAFAVADAIGGATDAIGKASKAKGAGEQVSGLLTWATSPGGLRTLGVIAACGAIWWAINNIEWQKLRDHMRGFVTAGGAK